MKSSSILPAIGLLVLIAAKTQAQEANIQINDDAVAVVTPQLQRTPLMTVHETAIPVQKLTAAEAKGATAKTSTKANSKAAVSTPPAQSPVVQTPIFMPGVPSQNVASGMNTTGNRRYDELIAKSAAQNGIDPDLMVAVMRQESGFNARARSYKGASGLMQLMPATAARFGVTNIYDPAQNIEGGARYLRFLLDTFNGDVDLVLAGYNAGEHAVMRSGYRIPRYRETQNYVRSISARYDRKKSRVEPGIASAGVAPSAQTFSNGRLSNNY